MTVKKEKGLKERRLEKGLTQQQLADMAGVAQISISTWERGEYPPKLALLYKLAAHLRCRPVDLLIGMIQSFPGGEKVDPYIMAHVDSFIQAAQRERADSKAAAFLLREALSLITRYHKMEAGKLTSP